MGLSMEVLNFIGTIAFALSGAVIAMEEGYDILGVIVLGLTTAFGGGSVRNVILGIPIETIWTQNHLFEITLLVVILFFFLPTTVIRYWNKIENLFDAIGLAAFAIIGANYAVNNGAPLSVVVLAATLTGAGGGIIRDVLAGRRPMVLQSDVYAVWGTLGGLVIGLGWVKEPFGNAILFVAIVVLRMVSVKYEWRLPRHLLHK